MCKKFLIIGSLLFCTSIAFANKATSTPELASEVISIHHAYVRAIPAGTANTAAYMELTNKGHFEHSLIAAIAPITKQTQLHITFFEKGLNDYSMARMRQVHDFPLQTGKTEKFQPGGHHIMLMGLHHALKAGQKVTITLIFAVGSFKTIEAPVESPQKSTHKSIP